MSDTTHLNLLSALQQKVDQFAKERDWEKFHTPKNLSMALAVEASELMEIFQWRDGQEAISHEVADVFIYLLRLCSVAGIDLLAAAETKLEQNAQKYPADLVRGKSNKYSEY
jgi:dCTP diphosphatase